MHPRWAAADRTVLAAGLAAALLIVALAVPALAVESATEQALDDPLDPVEETVTEPGETIEDSVDEAAEAVEDVTAEAARSTEDVVAKAEDETPEETPEESPEAPVDDTAVVGDAGGSSGGEAPAGSAPATGDGQVHSAGSATPIAGSAGGGGAGGGGTGSGGTGSGGTGGSGPDGGAPSPPAEAAGARTSATVSTGTASGPALQALRRGLRSESSLNLQAAAPPVVSAPFAFETPVVATPLTAVPTVPSMGALEAVFAPARADAAGRPLPVGVPGSLVATATGLLVLLGCAHLLHAGGRLRPREA